MKKYISIIVCLLMLVGCGQEKGSFEDGTLNMEKFYMDIMNVREDAKWRFAQLQDSNWTHKEIETKYHLDMTKVDDVVVRSSIISSDSELAIFKVTKKNEAYVKEAIEERMQDIREMYAPYKHDVEENLQQVKQGRMGEYYYFILGEDSKKVVNYIRNQT